MPTYVLHEFMQEIDDILNGAPINADKELFLHIVSYIGGIESWDKEVETQKIRKKEIISKKFADLYFWMDALQANLDLMRWEAERSHLQFIEAVSYSGQHITKKYNNIVCYDTELVSDAERKAHMELRSFIKNKIYGTEKA